MDGRLGSVDVVAQGASPHTAAARARAAFAATQQGAMIQGSVMPTNPHICKAGQRCACSFLPPR
jgi:hypothetical protein